MCHTERDAASGEVATVSKEPFGEPGEITEIKPLLEKLEIKAVNPGACNGPDGWIEDGVTSSDLLAARSLTRWLQGQIGDH